LQKEISDFLLAFSAILFVDAFCMLFSFPLFHGRIHASRVPLLIRVCGLSTTIFTALFLIIGFANPSKGMQWLLVAITSACFILGALLIGYWGMPFYINWRKHKNLRRAINKYRVHKQDGDPGEVLDPEASTYGAAWIPRLRVESETYYVARYFYNGNVRGILIFDEQGKVIRDKLLASKIMRCFHFAYQMCNGWMFSKRISTFAQLEFSLWYYRHWLSKRKWMRWRTRHWDKELSTELENLFHYVENLLIFLHFEENMILIEADYLNQTNGLYIKECSYDDLLKVEKKLNLERKAFFELKNAIKAEKCPLGLYSYFYDWGKRSWKPPAIVRNFLLVSRFYSDKDDFDKFLKKCPSRIKTKQFFSYMMPGEKYMWQDRLEYVDQTIRPPDAE
jgi:hypothetical protein